MMKNLIRYFAVLILAVTLSGCVNMDENTPPAPDYSKHTSWAALTEKIDKPVDVFYVYPTIYPEKSPKNMDFRRPDLQAAIKNLLKSQAGVYSESANLFAPYYRQMTFAELDSSKDMYQNRYFQIGAGDVLKAFNYYLANLNKSRPFIIAGHSQGSMVLVDLMRKRFDDPELRKRLVAAYLIGYSVTKNDLKKYPWMKAAKRADDTGVIISFNTQSPKATASPVLLPGAICINPLNWTDGPKPADKSLNLGAVFFDSKNGRIEKEVPHYAGARIDTKTGALLTVPPEKLDIGNFPPGVYHKFDYAFWYRNLQKNVAERIKAYLASPGNAASR